MAEISVHAVALQIQGETFAQWHGRIRSYIKRQFGLIQDERIVTIVQDVRQVKFTTTINNNLLVLEANLEIRNANEATLIIQVVDHDRNVQLGFNHQFTVEYEFKHPGMLMGFN